MIRYVSGLLAIALTLVGSGLVRADAAPSAAEIVEKMLESDPWGLSGAAVEASATIKDQGGSTRVVRFSARSRRTEGTLSKSIVRVTAPADLAGVGLLQVQKKGSDDDRHLFLPDLKRARRIAGGSRSGAFVGTDFSYGDIDRKEIRNAKATLVGSEKLGQYEVYHLTLESGDKDALYPKSEMWVRKDNFVPLKYLMYARSGSLVKTLLTKEVKRISGRWFITRSLMTSENEHRSTELVLEKVDPLVTIGDEELTVQALERI
jgi:hypothetical protein